MTFSLTSVFCLGSVQSHSHVWLFAIPLTAAPQASLSITNFQSLLKLMSIESVMSSNHLILCHPLLLPSIFPSIRVFSSESVRQSIGALVSALVLPMNIQNWFTWGLTSLISLQSKGLSGVFSNTTVKSINSSALSFLYSQTLTPIHDYWKNHSLD